MEDEIIIETTEDLVVLEVTSDDEVTIYITDPQEVSLITELIQGPPGPKGDTGDTGATGAQGNPGSPGADGADGPQGITGPKGDKGDKGDTGDTGATGSAGTPGTRLKLVVPVGAIDGVNDIFLLPDAYIEVFDVQLNGLGGEYFSNYDFNRIQLSVPPLAGDTLKVMYSY